jgi:hypothetical protein
MFGVFISADRVREKRNLWPTKIGGAGRPGREPVEFARAAVLIRPVTGTGPDPPRCHPVAAPAADVRLREELL